MAIKRESMQDVVNNSNYLLGKPQKFEDAFPEIEDIDIAYKESGYGVGKVFPTDTEKPTYHVRGKKYIGEYIRCSNPRCVHGGFSIGDKIREMVRNKQTVLECYVGCCGNESSPKGRIFYKSCYNSIEATITIVYKE